MTTTRTQIDDFLAQKRLALVGVSREAEDFSRRLFQELRERGYDVVPVNPAAAEIDGQRCFARVQDIAPAVDTALLLTSPEATDQVVQDCVEAGITRVWMHRGAGVGAVSDAAVKFCDEHGIQVVAGFCPYMFLPDAGFVHRLHGFAKKITGSYPA